MTPAQLLRSAVNISGIIGCDAGRVCMEEWQTVCIFRSVGRSYIGKLSYDACYANDACHHLRHSMFYEEILTAVTAAMPGWEDSNAKEADNDI